MNAGANSHPIYRFGLFEVNPHRGELTRKGLRVKLQEQPFQLLVLLLENAGDLVGRDVVRQRLWPGNTFVDFDSSLSVAIGKLREALGDSADNPRFIETIPRRGYRFIAPAKVGTPRDLTLVTPTRPSPASAVSWPSGSVPKHSWIIAGLVALLLGAAVYLLRAKIRPSPGIAQAGPSIARVHLRRSVAVLVGNECPGDWEVRTAESTPENKFSSRSERIWKLDQSQPEAIGRFSILWSNYGPVIVSD